MVTGGAGYIGAHVVDQLVGSGVPVVVVDDLSTGRTERLPADVPLMEVDLAAPGAATALLSIMRIYRIDAVVHLAGHKQVAESVRRPAWYYRQNVDGLLALHDAMAQAGVRRLVFSSSAAVYGDVAAGPEAEAAPVGEDAVPAPISPYGQTKLAGEWLNRAAYDAWGLRAVNLRYFNVAGASRPGLADQGISNLIPMVFAGLARGEAPRIFGSDYPTSDGTCVRDFVDVRDLAAAHVAALGYLTGEMRHGEVFNVGTGRGASVAEVVEVIGAVTGLVTEPILVDRRAGDPASVVADVSRIRAAMGWRAERSLQDMVRSAWLGWREHVAVPTGPASARRAAG